MLSFKNCKSFHFKLFLKTITKLKMYFRAKFLELIKMTIITCCKISESENMLLFLVQGTFQGAFVVCKKDVTCAGPAPGMGR